MNGSAHFAGELVAADAAITLGLHRVELQLVDDEGRSHFVYIAHGRGDEAQRRCIAQWRSLHIGQHYFGSATLRRTGTDNTHWAGSVMIKLNQRRPRFAVVAGTAAPKVAAC